MKKHLGCVSLGLLALLVLTPVVRADQSPARWVVIPEAIWATASGGGTWVTALQVTTKTSGTTVHVQFFYGTDLRTVELFTSTAAHQTNRYANILQTLGAIDTSFSYSGRVGTLLVFTTDDAKHIWAQAMTTNGNYGKTMPSFVWRATDNTAAVGRYMVIPGAMNSSTYRTFCGLWNSWSGSMTVHVYVMNPNGWYSFGSKIIKTIPAYDFISFNPFFDAGISANTYTNSWLLIWPDSVSGGSGEGLFCYGSIANNTTNDTYALIAVPFN